MLKIIVPIKEDFDQETSTFIQSEDFELELEHSLVSLSKWEQIFCKPFLSPGEKTKEETLTYVQCMILNDEVPENLFQRLTQKNIDDIAEYINSNPHGTTFPNAPKSGRATEIISAELVYYWMFSLNIDISCETWNLNRLFALIKVFNVKNSKPQKMSRAAAAEQRRALNEQRRKQSGSTG